jgi:hypothetical protein
MSSLCKWGANCILSAAMVPINSYIFYLRHVSQLSLPSHGPNRPRHMLCPATKKWQNLPCCGLLGARCQRLSRRRIHLKSLAFCQRCHWATLPVSDSAMRPLRSAVYHISKKTAQIALFATYRAIKTNWWWIGPRASRKMIQELFWRHREGQIFCTMKV